MPSAVATRSPAIIDPRSFQAPWLIDHLTGQPIPATDCILIYARVSDDPKYKGESVERQIDLGLMWAQSMGAAVGHIIRDDNRSASEFARYQREGWQKVKAIIAQKNRPETILWTWEDTRATREIGGIDGYSELEKLCTTYGMLWAPAGRIWNLSNADDQYFATNGIAMARRDSKKTSERVTGAMASIASKGGFHGAPPFGYVKVHEPEHPKSNKDGFRWAIAPEQGKLIDEMAKRFLSGESLWRIAQDFDSRGIPAPSKRNVNGWQIHSIKRILLNPATNGKREHNGNIAAQANWDAILDDETVAKLTARLTDPSRKTMKQAPQAHLLSGVARCGYIWPETGEMCNGPMNHKMKGDAGRDGRPTYECKNHHHLSRGAAKLEEYIEWAVIKMARNGSLLQVEPTEEFSELVAFIDKRRDDLRKNHDAWMSGVIEPTDFAQLKKRVEADIAEAENRMRPSTVPTTALELAAASDPLEYWTKLTTEQRREILRSTVEITLLPAKKGPGFKPESVVIRQR